MATISDVRYQFEAIDIASTTTIGEITDIISLMKDEQTVCLDIFFWGYYTASPSTFWNTIYQRQQITIKKNTSGLIKISEQVIYGLYEGETGSSVSFDVSVTGVSNEVIQLSATIVGVNITAFASVNFRYVDI